MSGTHGPLLGGSAPWPAPAKLNLCLHIVGRRADGYHLLQTAFQFIDLADELRFFARPPGVIERLGGPGDVAPDEDLAIRAARVLARGRDVSGVAIDVLKRIPLGGGLGGGSSDAATVLVALNELWQLELTPVELAALGLTLGADVPVFVRGRAAWAEGVGEQLSFEDWPERDYVVVHPGCAVATREIFQAAELTRNSPVTTIRDFRADGGRNDAAAVVRARFNEVSQAFDFLAPFGAPRLTGTGACVFLPVAGGAAGERVLARLPSAWRGYCVRGLNRSPLVERLASEVRADRRDSEGTGA
jgi:4-diphosphocytidyl-2-C-methyl-D-erythritol kinase